MNTEPVHCFQVRFITISHIETECVGYKWVNLFRKPATGCCINTLRRFFTHVWSALYNLQPLLPVSVYNTSKQYFGWERLSTYLGLFDVFFNVGKGFGVTPMLYKTVGEHFIPCEIFQRRSMARIHSFF